LSFSLGAPQEGNREQETGDRRWRTVRSPAQAGVALLPAKGGGSTPTLAVCGNPSCLAVLLYYWMVAETFRFPEIASCPKISFWGKRQKPPEKRSDGFHIQSV